MTKPSLSDIEDFAAEHLGEKGKPKPAKKNPKKKEIEEKHMGRPKKHEYSAEKKITAYIPEAIHKALRLKAAGDGKPMVFHICQALEKYLKMPQ